MFVLPIVVVVNDDTTETTPLMFVLPIVVYTLQVLTMLCCSLCYILFKNVSEKFEIIFVAKSSNSCKNSVLEI